MDTESVSIAPLATTTVPVKKMVVFGVGDGIDIGGREPGVGLPPPLTWPVTVNVEIKKRKANPRTLFITPPNRALDGIVLPEGWPGFVKLLSQPAEARVV